MVAANNISMHHGSYEPGFLFGFGERLSSLLGRWATVCRACDA